MKTHQTIRNFVACLMSLAIFSAAQAAELRDPVVLAGGSILDRASIAKVDRMERVATVVRETAEVATHRSVELQYVVDCANGTLNLVNWKMFSDSRARGELVWQGGLDPKDVSFRHEVRNTEQGDLINHLCTAQVAAR
jgi:hypothetical protein